VPRINSVVVFPIRQTSRATDSWLVFILFLNWCTSPRIFCILRNNANAKGGGGCSQQKTTWQTQMYIDVLHMSTQRLTTRLARARAGDRLSRDSHPRSLWNEAEKPKKEMNDDKYRTIEEPLDPHTHPSVSIANFCLSQYLSLLHFCLKFLLAFSNVRGLGITWITMVTAKLGIL
jgi:hypothetical protein